ncbi:phosphatidylinositol-specific phospholipase C [Nocardia sp. NPDC005978]|uniref:phosphatidylinositol-specific phospholipase C n=1 Tax=Nocardia sp. NPDC005978 TaxID=3156725 RepID=UPI0033A44ADB
MKLTRREFVRATVAAAAGAAATGLAVSGAQAAPSQRTLGAPRAWMSALPDSTSMLRLTIPGTHDSVCVDPANGTEWAHTQNWDLAAQFEHGIRFLDIRLNGLQDHMGDSFGLYHGPAYQGITFDGVLNRCRTFLTASSDEVLVMRVKKEDGTENDVGADFARVFDGYLDAKGYRPLFWIGDRMPTLGEARGRIVLITQFANALPALRWPAGDNGTFTDGRFHLQDRYKGKGLMGLDSGSAGGSASGSGDTASSGGDKFDHVRACFDKAAADPENTLQYINFLSYADNAWPKDNAKAILPKVERYLTENRSRTAHYGIVAMDFPDLFPNIVDLLLEKNFG